MSRIKTRRCYGKRQNYNAQTQENASVVGRRQVDEPGLRRVAHEQAHRPQLQGARGAERDPAVCSAPDAGRAAQRPAPASIVGSGSGRAKGGTGQTPGPLPGRAQAPLRDQVPALGRVPEGMSRRLPVHPVQEVSEPVPGEQGVLVLEHLPSRP